MEQLGSKYSRLTPIATAIRWQLASLSGSQPVCGHLGTDSQVTIWIPSDSRQLGNWELPRRSDLLCPSRTVSIYKGCTSGDSDSFTPSDRVERWPRTPGFVSLSLRVSLRLTISELLPSVSYHVPGSENR